MKDLFFTWDDGDWIEDREVFKDFLRKIANNYYKEEDLKQESKCDIIDIAEKELENIDSTEIDIAFKEVVTEEYTRKLIDLVESDSYTKKDLDNYLKLLDDKDILDIRVSDKLLVFKTTKRIIPISLSVITKVEEDIITQFPINGKYNFFFIDCKKYCSPKVGQELYDKKYFLNLMSIIGQYTNSDEYEELSEDIDRLINRAFVSNWIDMPEDIYFETGVENCVIAIAFDTYISNVKSKMNKILGVPISNITEVSGPTSTVLLIDCRRFFLEGMV